MRAIEWTGQFKRDYEREANGITIWFAEKALLEWNPIKTGTRGRPMEYSDDAIETAVFIRQVFHLSLRQTEGFMVSLARLMNAAISIPNFSSISKRNIESPRRVLSKAAEPGILVIVDSTGLTVYSEDEWHQEKHGVLARRTWRKLYLAVDENRQILACELTTPEVGDPTAVPDLLEKIETPFNVSVGDGAYDGEPVFRAVLAKQPYAQVIVPPHNTTVYSVAGDTKRDEHIRAIEEHGRLSRHKKIDYGSRSYIELAIQRYKGIISSCMKTRAMPQQKTEAWFSVSALNIMTKLGMPVSV